MHDKKKFLSHFLKTSATVATVRISLSEYLIYVNTKMH